MNLSNAKLLLFILASIAANPSTFKAADQSISGLIDTRLTFTDSVDSYLTKGYGKFRYSDGTQLSLAQLALHYRVEWDNNVSFHLITNGYIDDVNNGFGITESYFKYRSFPKQNGLRYEAKLGFMYPKISLENNATGWSSPYTLSYSTMNSWIGEEVRHLGLEASVTRLGKFSNSDHDFTLTSTLFTNNDTSGALLAWHGWTTSSRQSFWNEKLNFPSFPALQEGFQLENQAWKSDPFTELDSLTGLHLTAQWNWRGKSKVLAGYYDNRSRDNVVKYGQYTWQTSFSHLAVKWKLTKTLSALFQYINGSSRMGIANNIDVVDIDFHNAFLLLSNKWGKLRLSARFEIFKINDLDNIAGDDNNEDGKAATLSLAYPLSKQLFSVFEYNWINSKRPSRYYLHLDRKAVESQLQLGLRYYF